MGRFQLLMVPGGAAGGGLIDAVPDEIASHGRAADGGVMVSATVMVHAAGGAEVPVAVAVIIVAQAEGDVSGPAPRVIERVVAVDGWFRVDIDHVGAGGRKEDDTGLRTDS